MHRPGTNCKIITASNEDCVAPHHNPLARASGHVCYSDPLLSGSISNAILKLAGPMFASAMLQNAQSLIDLFWVGRLGPASVAALALSGAVLMALFPIQIGLATGTVALVSRAYGAGDERQASALAAQSITLAVTIGIILGLGCLPLIKTICTLLGAAPEVVVEAVRYLTISMYGMAISLILFMANSALQAAGNTVLPMLAMLAANLLNLVLDPLMIFGWRSLPGFGVAGAAWATVIAQAIAALGLLSVMFSGQTHLHLKLPDFRPRWHDGLRLLRIGLPSMAQMSSRSIMGLVFFRIIARFGTAVVAGYGIGMRWHMVFLMPCFVLGNAAATLWGLQVPLALYFIQWFDPAVHGVWWAMNTATLLHATLSVIWFATGRWMLQKV